VLLCFKSKSFKFPTYFVYLFTQANDTVEGPRAAAPAVNGASLKPDESVGCSCLP
jgi:hypothetical protein